MVNPGAHYRCPEAWGRLFAIWESNGAYNTIDTNVGAYNTILCQGGCGALFPQAYRVWSRYRGLTCALPSPFAPGPFRVDVPGRMAPVGPGRAS